MIPVLDKIRRAGGRVVVRDQAVRIEAPPGTLTDADRQVLADHREVLLRLLAPSIPVEDQAEREAVVRVEALDPAEAAVVVEAAVRDWDGITGGGQQRHEPAAVDQADQDQHPGPPVVDLDAWLRDNTVEPIVCGKCGSLDQWQDCGGSWHCGKCDPPIRAAIIRERAARLRRRYASVQR